MSSGSLGFWQMLRPKRIAARRRLRSRGSSGGKGMTLLLIGAIFWLAAYGIIYRILRYFQGVEDIGDLLAAKLLGLVLLAFLGVLLLSNVITALSTFFLSRDLELLVSAPAEAEQVYLAKLAETTVNSHVSAILHKLGVASRVQAILLASHALPAVSGPSEASAAPRRETPRSSAHE